MLNTHYRKEIDGLRAIAVLVIILFHMKIPGFWGGFVGVDVFFVVSGFLITQIIVSSLQTGQFTFRDFYIRRVARIIPALAFTVAAVLVCAIYFQHPGELVHTAQQSIYALLSVSNLFFWSETSYWAPSAEKFVLLHTWSLGVEEQFYLVYPLILFVAHRLGGVRGVVAILILTLGVGLYAGDVVTKSDRVAAFFFTPLRFYEFALGGLGVVLVRRMQWLQSAPWLASAITLLGVLLILSGTVLFNSLTPVSSVRMLIPLSGALLIILAGASPSARLLLSNSLMSWLGKVSYSLYLVHWPIIVFYRAEFEPHPSPLQLLGLFGAILIAAALLNRYVERPFRLSRGGESSASGMPTRKVLWYTCAAVLLTSIVSGMLIAAKGWPSRMPPAVQALMEIDLGEDRRARKRYLEETCTPAGEIYCGQRTPGKRTIMLLADSRGTDIYVALKEAYPETNIMVAYAAGCPPTFSSTVGDKKFLTNCSEFNQARLKEAVAAPDEDIIFLAANLSKWRQEAMLDTARRLRATGKTVFMLGEFRITAHKSPIDIAIGELRFGDERYLERFISEEPFKLDGAYAEKVTALGARYVSNKPLFYDGRYHFDDRETGELLTQDGKHLTTFGAKKFGQYLRANYPLP